MADEKGLGDPGEKLVAIIDDDTSVLGLWEEIALKEGFRVKTAEDGEKGMWLIHDVKPDLIMLDLMLPRYGGFEILRQLQEGEFMKVPVIVITGRYTDSSTAEMVRSESNVAEFFTKPVSTQALAMSLHRILKTRPPTRG